MPRRLKLEGEQARFLAKKFAGAASTQPRLHELRRRLLRLGGVQLVAPRDGEADLEALLDFGVAFPGRAKLRRGRRSDCHDNAGRLYAKAPERTRIVTGYALSDDGLWRQHSWALVDDRLVETTEPRELYFGFLLPAERARRWAERSQS